MKSRKQIYTYGLEPDKHKKFKKKSEKDKVSMSSKIQEWVDKYLKQKI